MNIFRRAAVCLLLFFPSLIHVVLHYLLPFFVFLVASSAAYFDTEAVFLNLVRLTMAYLVVVVFSTTWAPAIFVMRALVSVHKMAADAIFEPVTRVHAEGQDKAFANDHATVFVIHPATGLRGEALKTELLVHHVLRKRLPPNRVLFSRSSNYIKYTADGAFMEAHGFILFYAENGLPASALFGKPYYAHAVMVNAPDYTIAPDGKINVEALECMSDYFMNLLTTTCLQSGKTAVVVPVFVEGEHPELSIGQFAWSMLWRNDPPHFRVAVGAGLELTAGIDPNPNNMKTLLSTYFTRLQHARQAALEAFEPTAASV